MKHDNFYKMGSRRDKEIRNVSEEIVTDNFTPQTKKRYRYKIPYQISREQEAQGSLKQDKAKHINIRCILIKMAEFKHTERLLGWQDKNKVVRTPP